LELSTLYNAHHHFEKIVEKLQKQLSCRIGLKGLTGSASSVFAANVINKSNQINLFILNDKEEAAYFASDLITINGEDTVQMFPSSFKRSIQYNQPDQANIILRTETFNRINNFFNDKQPFSIVTYPEALVEKVVSRDQLIKSTLHIHKNEKISIQFVKEVLQEYQFDLTEFVYEPGQYSIRGSIVDIFSYSSDLPYRIDFFGDEVESIRSFEIESQLSKEKKEIVSIIPNVLQYNKETGKISFMDYIPSGTVIWSGNMKYFIDKVDLIHQAADNDDRDNEIINSYGLSASLSKFSVVEYGLSDYFADSIFFEFYTIPQPVFNKNFELLVNNLSENRTLGYKNYILTENPKQAERLQQIVHDLYKESLFTPLLQTIHEGFVDKDLGICFYTDHQIFERYHKFKAKKGYLKNESISINELRNLQPGDYIVHIDHGIGKFGGLEKIHINGREQEAIKLVYQDMDTLYVSIHSLHRISKYKGKDGSEPKIYKLGSGAWQKLKDNTKRKVKDIAKDLIALYAKRMSSEGFRFSQDTYMQQELEASFIYEDTPDQEKATKAVKSAMESEHPMDMLVCGDVGYGKTEVAIRAAFKAVADNKQVAVLVPTTILALQHYNTFKDRLRNFPCNIDYISRLKSVKQVKESLKKLEEGKTDIIIGTHKLVGSQVKFKDMGLLIIDEEQKFGVAVKEKLKNFKINVDTLTLTATPIPRTLQFSLMGARDLSIINTPPPNRHPIQTEIHSFNEDIIREAIEYEISRGGQVFFIHNRVQNIYEVELLLRKICKNIKIVVVHGQMEGEKLEKTILDFINGDIDLLIATNIIENGLDIPNANTIIINNAQNFGLSDLHQLRGRVGRSNRKAFCYLLAPPLAVLTSEARRRLKAIEDYSDLSSGFNIAMQDLDIRGAGNMLGGEQSGFIADIGFEAYQRILNETIQELKENEYKDLFFNEQQEKDQTRTTLGMHSYVSDCQIDTDLGILFPDEYINNISERTRLYRELDNMDNEEKLNTFKSMLIDRFGPLPKQAEELLQVLQLRWKAIEMGIEKIILKNDKMIVYFVSNQMSPFYQSGLFMKMISEIQKHAELFKMKEAKDRLSMSVEKIKSISDALKILKKLEGEK